jgi:hypothetical protein
VGAEPRFERATCGLQGASLATWACTCLLQFVREKLTGGHMLIGVHVASQQLVLEQPMHVVGAMLGRSEAISRVL